MARLNIVHMKGVVAADPTIVKRENASMGRASLVLARDTRKVENRVKHAVQDRPYIITTEEHIVAQMEKISKYDIIYVKGVLSTRKIPKTSYCAECGEKNTVEGILTYVTPLSIEKVSSVENEDEMIAYLNQAEVRPTSNEVHVFGRLTRDPKKVSPKSGLVVTQYQIALNRKYIIRDDPPEVRADYPWVKSYGEAAEEDRFRLMKDSIVFIDGYLQTRNVNKHQTCVKCGKLYDWTDRAMELVPYDTEYIMRYRSDEEIEKIKKDRAAQAWRDVFGTSLSGNDEITKEDIEAGMDDFTS